MFSDFDRCYGVISSRDARFDGMFITAVTSTGIYCRPSCPALTPKRSNVHFFPTAAAAQAAGFRACKRCRPDASPGSPEWNVRADVVARAMRLIADGIVDREGVAGLARRLFLSERQLNRLLTAELGAGPQALARAHRAQTARVLIETTDLPFSEVAFAAGFASIRQFNDTTRQVFASSPTELRRSRRSGRSSPAGVIVLRLPYRAPFDAGPALAFFGARAVPGVESFDGNVYRRSLRLPHSSGTVELEQRADHVSCTLRLADVRDLAAAVQRCRRMLDLDADPAAIDESLRRDRVLRPLVRSRPGLRIPGTADGDELAIRAVIGQQISVAGARTLAGKLVAEFGKPLTAPDDGLTHVFPAPDALADADLERVKMPRRNTIRALATALASGEVTLDPGAERSEVKAKLVEIPGIGPWTASYVALRALNDPDEFMPTDLGVRKALHNLGVRDDPDDAGARWRPWRSYAQQHLWTSLG